MEERIREIVKDIRADVVFGHAPDQEVDYVQAILTAVVESLPEKIDVDSKYEGLGKDGGIDIEVADDENAGDNLTHLAQFASDQGYNQAIDDMRKGLGK